MDNFVHDRGSGLVKAATNIQPCLAQDSVAFRAKTVLCGIS
jgi:hypothetical protein